MRVFKSLIFLFLITTIHNVSIFGQVVSKNDDDYLYNKIVTVRGTVTVKNTKDDKTSIRTGAYLIFQRTDCKLCLVATSTDIDGNYEIKISRGKYRLIVREGTQEGKMYDVLDSSQPRFLEAKPQKSSEVIEFNILLRYPDNSLHRTIEN